MFKFIALLVFLGIFKSYLALECYVCNESHLSKCVGENQKLLKCSDTNSTSVCEVNLRMGSAIKRCAVVNSTSNVFPDCHLEKNNEAVESCFCMQNGCNKETVNNSTIPNRGSVNYFNIFGTFGLLVPLLTIY